MKQTIKTTAFLLVILFFATSLNAQTEHRYTINPVFSIEKEILPVLTTGADVEANYCNAANSNDFSIKPFIQYSPINYLVLGAEYRVKYEVVDGESAWQGRLGLAAKGKYAFGNLKLDCRLKYTLYTDVAVDFPGPANEFVVGYAVEYAAGFHAALFAPVLEVFCGTLGEWPVFRTDDGDGGGHG